MTEQTQISTSQDKPKTDCWVNTDLIPKELLDPARLDDMVEYIAKNIEMLTQVFQKTLQEDNYQIVLPPSEEYDKAYEIHIVDRKTGNVVKVLEKTAHFQLCNGIILQIKAKDLENWKKETAETKKLTKEQSEDLKTFISNFGSERPLTRKEIVTFIEEIRKPKKTPKYRQSGHLIDEKLKYSTPNSQTTPFDLLPETKHKIEESKIEVKAEGIKLTPSENKLIHALNRILHEKSQNSRNSQDAGFYDGNISSEIVPYGSNLKLKAAVLKFKPAELYKSYIGHNRYSSHDIQFINEVLHQLESKKVLIKYDRIKKVKKGKKTEILTDRIEDFQSLIKIISFIPDLTSEEKERLDSGGSISETRGEIVIGLNPIFTDQIDTKFIEFPVDTNRRLVIAVGGHNRVTSSMMTLMEWMLREMSNKRYKAEINEEKLPYLLGLDKYIKQNRKKLLQERIGKDIEAVTNMGIILRHEKIQNSTGGFKWIFYLNKDYE